MLLSLLVCLVCLVLLKTVSILCSQQLSVVFRPQPRCAGLAWRPALFLAQGPSFGGRHAGSRPICAVHDPRPRRRNLAAPRAQHRPACQLSCPSPIKRRHPASRSPARLLPQHASVFWTCRPGRGLVSPSPMPTRVARRQRGADGPGGGVDGNLRVTGEVRVWCNILLWAVGAQRPETLPPPPGSDGLPPSIGLPAPDPLPCGRRGRRLSWTSLQVTLSFFGGEMQPCDIRQRHAQITAFQTCIPIESRSS